MTFTGPMMSSPFVGQVASVIVALRPGCKASPELGKSVTGSRGMATGVHQE